MIWETFFAEDDVSKIKSLNRFYSSALRYKSHSLANFEQESQNYVRFDGKKIIKVHDLVAGNKSTGPDFIGNYLLKNCSKTLSRSLKPFFSKFHKQGHLSQLLEI